MSGYTLFARLRMWGLPVIRAWESPEPQAVTAASSPPVNLTVVYVQAGAHMAIGAMGVSPRIIQGAPDRGASTEGDQ